MPEACKNWCGTNDESVLARMPKIKTKLGAAAFVIAWLVFAYVGTRSHYCLSCGAKDNLWRDDHWRWHVGAGLRCGIVSVFF